MLIDSGSTHNFINYKLAKDLNFVFPAPEFQVMIADGGTINCSGKCHSIKLNMGEYLLDSPMISIQMGGVDVVLGVQWLQSLGTMALNFQDLFMRFSSEGKEIELRGIQGKPSKVIIQEVEYLGHIVSHEGVKVDPNKIKSIREWPIPKTLK
jgi:hypothetical protein